MPSSSCVRRAAAANGASPGYGWPQQVLDQTPGSGTSAGAALEQQPPVLVEEEHRERPVQLPGRLMGGELLRGADGVAVLVDQFEQDRLGVPFDVLFVAVAGEVGITILRIGPRRP